MCKNNKNRQRTLAAKQRNRTKGFKGPATTVPSHGKKRAWFQVGDSNNPKAQKKGKETES